MTPAELRALLSAGTKGPYRAEFGAIFHEDQGGFLFTVSSHKMAEEVAAALNFSAAFRPAVNSLEGLLDRVEALEWLSRNTNCELCHQYGEEGDQPDEWRVYRITGNRSDREWIVIGRGDTPFAALLSARKLKEPTP